MADRKVLGTLAASGDKVFIHAEAMATVTFQIAAGLVGTVTFEATNDDAAAPAFDSVPAERLSSGSRALTAVNPSGLYRIDAAGYRGVQVRVSAFTSGTTGTNGVIANASSVPFARESENYDEQILASGARTTTQTTGDFTMRWGTGAWFLLNVTANPGGAETLTFALQVKDGNNGAYKTITAFAATAAAANAAYSYGIFPGAVVTSAIGNTLVQGLPLSRQYRVVVTHSGAGSWTYSLGAMYVKS